MAALAVFLALFLFCLGHYLAGVIVIVLIAAVALMSFFLDVREVGAVMLMAMTGAVLLSYPVLTYAGNGLGAPLGSGIYEITVTSVQARLDGKRRICGLTDSGAMVASVLPAEANG